jgi:hypothetical protein
LPSVIGWSCLALAVPVVVAAVLMWRQEQLHGEGGE